MSTMWTNSMTTHVTHIDNAVILLYKNSFCVEKNTPKRHPPKHLHSNFRSITPAATKVHMILLRSFGVVWCGPL